MSCQGLKKLHKDVLSGTKGLGTNLIDQDVEHNYIIYECLSKIISKK